MFCQRAKEFLRGQGVDFEERDVSADQSALAELEALGFMTTPVLLIDGETVIGFDRPRIEALIGGPGAAPSG